MTGKGNDFQVQGINAIGMERLGLSKNTIQQIKKIYKIFYLQNLTVSEALDKIISSMGITDEVKTFIDFVKSSKVGFIR